MNAIMAKTINLEEWKKGRMDVRLLCSYVHTACSDYCWWVGGPFSLGLCTCFFYRAIIMYVYRGSARWGVHCVFCSPFLDRASRMAYITHVVAK